MRLTGIMAVLQVRAARFHFNSPEGWHKRKSRHPVDAPEKGSLTNV